MTLPAPLAREQIGVSYVADFYRRYPGEQVSFYARIEILDPVPGLTVRVTVPEGLELLSYQQLVPPDDPMPIIELLPGATRLVWRINRSLPAGTTLEYRVTARVAPTERELVLESRAYAFWAEPNGRRHADEETVAIVVFPKGRYLDYLPGLYSQDELMGRFLMLFESFWAPIDKQIETMPFYFDPALTTPEFLPWLASWLDLALDERLPLDRQRRLVQSAVSLYRQRGTKSGLQKFLEIYTGGQVEIIEHRARNLRLGPDARLGPGIALGRTNVPHTFTVKLRLPPLSEGADDRERARKALERRRAIETLIESEKPAHTAYTLVIEETTGDA